MSASWIAKLNESDSRLHKEDVLRQALEAATLGSTNAINFLTLIKACYNPYATFGVKKVEDKLFETDPDAENPWEEFIDLLAQLSGRLFTGHAARDAIEAMSARFSMNEWNNFCAPVIRRDLRAGISATTINKICKKTPYEIPVFKCQLATNSENRPEMKGEMRLEPKLDGVRVLMVVKPASLENTSVTCYSRNGKIFDNFGHIESQIIENYKELVKDNRALRNGFVLDGEVVGSSFQELMRQARRKENVESSDTVFHIFDILPLEDFLRGHWNAQLHKRIALLESMRNVIDTCPNLELVSHINVNLDTAEGRDQMFRYANDMVGAGYEGIMIKDVGAPYECARNTFWMKWKPTLTVDLQVVGVEEGTGRNKGRLGALSCAGSDFDKEIKVNVGSGFTDSDRDSLWEDRNLVVGRTVEILCDSISQNQDGTYSLRFPRFVRFRDDK